MAEGMENASLRCLAAGSLVPNNYKADHFWATITSNGSPYATGPLSCLSVCL